MAQPAMYPPIVAKRFVGAFEQAYTPEGVVDAIATFRELIASYPEVPNAYHILASLLATEDALRGEDRAATLDDHHEAVEMLEDVLRIARRVFGVPHPLTGAIEDELRNAPVALCARRALRARETTTTP